MLSPKDMAKIWQRYGKDMAKIWQRYGWVSVAVYPCHMLWEGPIDSGQKMVIVYCE